MSTISRRQILDQLTATYEDPAKLKKLLDPVKLPKALSDWFGRLKLLYGVPINYLVPDEGMLPSESIRFFYLDSNWVDALVDGAFSIGRNLTPQGDTVSMKLDQVMHPRVGEHANVSSLNIRADALGVTAPVVSLQTISGFLLRSSLVSSYPGLGVNAYPAGGTPSDSQIVLLDIVRMERLGPQSDTLICLLAGDAVQIDIHEAPEALHYGIDKFTATTATKAVNLFTTSGNTVTIDTKQVPLDLLAGNAFRPNSRTVKMSTVAGLIAAAQQPAIPSINAAEMGFEMTEGVGSVSFKKQVSQS